MSFYHLDISLPATSGPIMMSHQHSARECRVDTYTECLQIACGLWLMRMRWFHAFSLSYFSFHLQALPYALTEVSGYLYRSVVTITVRWPTMVTVPYRIRNLGQFYITLLHYYRMSAEQELCESDLLELAEHLSADTWKDFGRRLGLRNGELQDIEVKHRTEHPRELRLQMLLLWFQRCPTGSRRWHALKQAAIDNGITKMIEHINSKQGMSW